MLHCRFRLLGAIVLRIRHKIICTVSSPAIIMEDSEIELLSRGDQLQEVSAILLKFLQNVGIGQLF